jgi:GNAT superfamily N-acetyltransferase
MTNRITIVRATIDHLSEVTQLFNCYRCFYGQKSDRDGAEAFLAERLRRADSVILLALRQTLSVGFVQLYPSFSSVAMKRLWILNDLFVAEVARQEGVGLALTQEAHRFAKETNAARLVLATGTDNLAAQALYENMGWVRDSAFIHFNFDL